MLFFKNVRVSLSAAGDVLNLHSSSFSQTTIQITVLQKSFFRFLHFSNML
jgi:hypothetical protein